jgi:glycosyltransferase involved in cell wall biosynthesis
MASRCSNLLKVLHVHSGNIFGGIETMLLTHVRERQLCPSMETSFALCFDGRFSEELAAAGATIHRLGAVRIRDPLSVRRARRNLQELLRRESFDVVVVHSCWSQAIFGQTIQAAGLPLVFYLHAPPNGRHWLERLAKRTQPDLVICNSKFTAGSSSLLYRDVPTEVVYCPVSPPNHQRSLESRKTLRAELNTPDDAVVIIQVGRMERGKGHAVHIEAVAQLKEIPNWVCWQVGGAQKSSELSYLGKLKNKAVELGISDRVLFANERSDIADLMAAADIYCQPNSRPDSFGIAFIEALYASLPVVTSDLGGAPEIVDDTCGVLIPADDVDELGVVLRRLIQDGALRSALGSAGPVGAKKICDPAMQLSRFQKVLDSLTVGHQPSATDREQVQALTQYATNAADKIL